MNIVTTKICFGVIRRKIFNKIYRTANSISYTLISEICLPAVVAAQVGVISG